jgi:hypothetical protein
MQGRLKSADAARPAVGSGAVAGRGASASPMLADRFAEAREAFPAELRVPSDTVMNLWAKMRERGVALLAAGCLQCDDEAVNALLQKAEQDIKAAVAASDVGGPLGVFDTRCNERSTSG